MSEELIRQPGESIVDFARRKFAATTGLNPDEVTIQREVPKEGPAPLPRRQWDADLIPEAPYNRSAEQYAMDDVLGRIDIIEAYNRWCGKMKPHVGNRRESIKVSCPDPAHRDADPSAWVNLDKGDGGVGHCGSCGIGFDKYDIAAWHFGFGVPDYKGKDEFPLLREAMARDFGFELVVEGKDEWLVKIEPDQPVDRGEVVSGATDVPPPSPDEAAIPASSGTSDAHIDAELQRIIETQDEDVDEFTDTMDTPKFNWRTFPALRPGTFMAEWMDVTSRSYEPEEFYFWLGLQALAMAVGNNVKYSDARPFRSNLMVCLVGPTGVGKSLAMSTATHLIREALPWDPELGSGVRMIKPPGSGEALVDQFHHQWPDPVDPKKFEVLPVNGLLREDELATLISKRQRQGSNIREKIMEFYDSVQPVEGQARSTGPVSAKDHYFNMMSSTQPGSMRALLSDNDLVAGFLNRWCWITGTPKYQPSVTHDLLDISTCYDPLRAVRAWASGGHLVGFVNEAHPAFVMWDEFFHREVVPLSLDEDRPIAARLPMLARKIMMLLAINDHSEKILVPHVETMIKLWDYLKDTYGLVSGQVGVDDKEDCQRRIESYAAKYRDREFTIRDLAKSSSARKHRSETIVQSVELLEKAGVLIRIREAGQKVPRYKYYSENEPARR